MRIAVLAAYVTVLVAITFEGHDIFQSPGTPRGALKDCKQRRRPVKACSIGRGFIGQHFKTGQLARTERRGNRNVSRIPSMGHQNASDAGNIVSGVKSVPAVPKEDLKPGAKIHRRRVGRNPDIPQIACAVSRRDVHAAAQSDCKMCKVPANTPPGFVGLPCGFRGISVLVTELKMLVHVVANRLDQRPSFGVISKSRPSKLDKAIRLAITTA